MSVDTGGLLALAARSYNASKPALAQRVEPLVQQDSSLSFSDLVRDVIHDTHKAVERAENLEGDYLRGKVDVLSLSAALSDAELRLQSMTKLQNRMLNAYKEIMNMAI